MMKILLVNKFLYPNGGSETYIFKLNEALRTLGHHVEFFGMDDPRNIVGNTLGSYTDNMDFRGNGRNIFTKLNYARQIIYSKSARHKIHDIITSFKPDVVHLNNINFQITPSIIYEIKEFGLPIVWTTHDYQLVCPNHMFYIPQKKQVCELCMNGKFSNCTANNCLHESRAQSFLAAYESRYYRNRHTYRLVDKFICPSYFIEQKLSTNPDIAGRTVTMHNFIDHTTQINVEKHDYVLYFGRFDKEKGIETLINVAKSLPNIPFAFAGKGELAAKFEGIPNIRNYGFVSDDTLDDIICRARLSVYPSEWYENCPFSIMESQQFKTPVLGADIGGIPELIRENETGLLFKSGDEVDLRKKIEHLWNHRDLLNQMSENCQKLNFDTPTEYAKKLLSIYSELIARKSASQ